jgi:hypothetical protein
VEFHRSSYSTLLNGLESEGRTFSCKDTIKTPVGTNCNRFPKAVAILHVFLCAPYPILILVISSFFHFLRPPVPHLLPCFMHSVRPNVPNLMSHTCIVRLAGLTRAPTEPCANYVNLLYLAVEISLCTATKIILHICV